MPPRMAIPGKMDFLPVKMLHFLRLHGILKVSIVQMHFAKVAVTA